MNLIKKAAQYIGPAGTEKLEDNGKHITSAILEKIDEKGFNIQTNQGNYRIEPPIIGQHTSAIVLDKSQFGVGITLGTSFCCYGYLQGFVIGQDEEGKFGLGMRFARELDLNPRDIVPLTMNDVWALGYLTLGSACSGSGVRLVEEHRGQLKVHDIIPRDETRGMYLERFKVTDKGIFIVEPRRDLTDKLKRAGVNIDSTLKNLSSYERFPHGAVMKKIVSSGTLKPGREKAYEKEIAEYDLVDKYAFQPPYN